MKQLLALGAVAVVVAFATAHPRSAAPSILTVSLQRVATQSNLGKRATQQLDTLKQERMRELTARQKELEDVVRQLAKGDALPAADRERLSQDDARRRTELQQLTGDPRVAPAWVLPRQAQDEFANATLNRWPSRRSLRLRPSAAYELSVPAQQRLRRDEQAVAARRRQQPGCAGK